MWQRKRLAQHMISETASFATIIDTGNARNASCARVCDRIILSSASASQDLGGENCRGVQPYA